jgi:hypothetical protein
MHEEIPQLLKNLRLRKMAEIVDAELTAAGKASPSYSELLARPLRVRICKCSQLQGRARVLIRSGISPTGMRASSFIPCTSMAVTVLIPQLEM